MTNGDTGTAELPLSEIGTPLNYIWGELDMERVKTFIETARVRESWTSTFSLRV